MTDLLVMLLGVIAILVVLDVMAVTFGVDSRPRLGDDHRRSAG